MKKIKKLTIIILVLAAAALGACTKINDDSALRRDGFFRVNFDCTGGQIGNYSISSQYALPDSLLLEPGKHPEFGEAILKGHRLVGWFLGESDSAGRVTYLKQWDFKTNKMPAQDITLYAKWDILPTFVILYGDDFALRATYNVTPQGTIMKGFTPPSWSGHTLVGYYADKALKIPFDTDTYKHNKPDGKKEEIIYTKWLVGEYKLVRSAADMTTLGTVTQYYLMNNIDFKGKAWGMLQNFSGKIIGNGYKIENLAMQIKQEGVLTNYGLFGTLTNASITDLTFEKCSVTIEIGKNATFSTGFLAGSILGNSEFDKVVMNNCSLAIVRNKNIPGAQLATVLTGKLSGNNLPATVKVTNCNYEGITITDDKIV